MAVAVAVAVAVSHHIAMEDSFIYGTYTTCSKLIWRHLVIAASAGLSLIYGQVARTDLCV